MALFGTKSFIGVDIGSHAVKAVEVQPVGQKWRMVHAGTGPTPPGAVKEGAVIEPQALGVAVRQVLAGAGIRAGRVVSAVGGQAVIVRELKLPPMTDSELKQAARFEAERYIPYGAKEVNMDFDVIGESVEEGQKKTVMLLVAARREIVDRHMQALLAAGLQPFVLDVESFAVMRALNAQATTNGEGATVFVDIGAESTDIMVTEAGEFRLTRNVNIGGDSLTKAVAGRMEMEFQSAAQLKEEKGMVLLEGEPLPDDRMVLSLHDVMLPILGDLSTEIRRSLDYFQTRWRGSKVARVVLSGGTARLRNLDRFLSLELGVPAVVGNPFIDVEVPDKVLPAPEREQAAPAMTTAVGLALRGAAER
ncbi:MAG: type IV pilus assembly protein PilM [bacterium]